MTNISSCKGISLHKPEKIEEKTLEDIQTHEDFEKEIVTSIKSILETRQSPYLTFTKVETLIKYINNQKEDWTEDTYDAGYKDGRDSGYEDGIEEGYREKDKEYKEKIESLEDDIRTLEEKVNTLTEEANALEEEVNLLKNTI